MSLGKRSKTRQRHPTPPVNRNPRGEIERLKNRIAELEQTFRDFIARLAHELRGPLHNLRLYLNAMASRSARRGSSGNDDTMPQLLAWIELAIHRVQEAELYSELQRNPAAGLFAESEEYEDLCSLVEKCVGLFIPLLEDKDKRLAVDRPRLLSLPKVLMVRRLARHAMRSIILHAYEYARPGTAVCVTGSRTPRSGLVHICVKHRMAKGDRAPASTLLNPENRAVDYSPEVLRAIAEIHGGSIDARMHPSQTCVVTLAFPLCR